MIRRLLHALRVRAARKHEADKEARSPRWAAVRDSFLHVMPRCAACLGNVELQVHHVVPFHVNPALELMTSNLITLCMGKDECHLAIGHGGSFKFYNPFVILDLHALKMGTSRWDQAKAQAKASRIRL